MPPSDGGPGLSETRAASFSPSLRERNNARSTSPAASIPSSVPSITPKSCPSCVVVEIRTASTSSPKFTAVHNQPTINDPTIVLSHNRLYGAPASPQNSSSVTSSSSSGRSRGSSSRGKASGSSHGTKTFSDNSGSSSSHVRPSNCHRMSCCAVEPTTSTANSANSRQSCLSAFRVTGSSMQSAANSPSTSPLPSSDSAVLPTSPSDAIVPSDLPPLSPPQPPPRNYTVPTSPSDAIVLSDLPPLSPPQPPPRNYTVPTSPSDAIVLSALPSPPPSMPDDPALLPMLSDDVVSSAPPSPAAEAAPTCASPLQASS
ncbi:hypothetical protein Vretifemale_13617, partial [Volvox reticuliferus]